MVTIKEIAKRAGVSHGTVSNVLNGRGNVSMKKILLVEQAARELGYSIDERSKQLHQGFERSIAVVLPQLRDPRYGVIYSAILQCLQEMDYRCSLYLTNDIPAQEESILGEIAGRRLQGVILVTCQPAGSEARELLRKSQVSIVALEREAADIPGYVGFDFAAIRERVVSDIQAHQCRHVSIITGLLSHSFESAFLSQLEAELQSMNVYYHSYQTDSATASGPAFSVAADPTESDAVITTSLSFAGKVADAYAFCGKACPPHTITLSPMGSLSERNDVTQIELNWKRAAKLACMMVLGETAPARRLLQPYTRPIFVPAAIPAKKTEINVLMLEGPETRAMMKLIPDFTRSTGISVRFMVYPYDELHETIRSMESFGFFDVIRMDVAWLESLYDGRLVGFDPADPTAASILDPMLEAVREPFSLVNGTIHAFPFTPNLQLQFYRRDLFEDSKVRRSFYELNRSNLSVPTDYEEYRKLLRFFSRINNPSSPVEYGASVVSGNNTAIVCEFMPILSSLGGRLFDGKGRPCVDTPQAVESLKMYLDIQRNSYQVPSGGWWRASVDSFTHGDTAMMNMFINHVSGITDLRKSRIAGRIGFSAIPGGKPLLGGGVLGVAEHSTKKEAAMEFIRWACSDHISIPFTLLGGISPCKSVYQSEELLELYPWLSIVPENHLKAVSRHMPIGIDEYRVESILGRAIKNAIFGICSPEEALQHAQHILEGMTAK